MTEDRLPPGQIWTAKFPVVGERAPSPAGLDLRSWRLRVDGLVARPLELDWVAIQALPHEERTTDIHCVTGWSRRNTVQRGVPLRVLLERAEVDPRAGFVRFAAFSERGHDTTLPLARALAETWLVDAIDGEPLSVEHGFPLRTVTPSRYFYKSLKWLARIELLEQDRLGYWERESAYHNDGDPWPGDQRFTTGSIEPEELARLRAGENLGPWRLPRKVVLAADLSGWAPRDRDLRRLKLKNCRLDGAHLDGVDLRESNLSLSSLRGASLAGADLRDADVEGADLSGADLSGADLRGAALSATRFVSELDGGPFGATVRDVDLRGASGLLEDQERYLRDHGARLE